jgi:hypothetical protein
LRRREDNLEGAREKLGGKLLEEMKKIECYCVGKKRGIYSVNFF